MHLKPSNSIVHPAWHTLSLSFSQKIKFTCCFYSFLPHAKFHLLSPLTLSRGFFHSANKKLTIVQFSVQFLSLHFLLPSPFCFGLPLSSSEKVSPLLKDVLDLQLHYHHGDCYRGDNEQERRSGGGGGETPALCGLLWVGKTAVWDNYRGKQGV